VITKAGGGWLHEIKYDGYRMHARIDGGQVKLLTRTGLGRRRRTGFYRKLLRAMRRPS
jgi:bifunctional non-homologous end joining protein LigD